jgi:hypothetical protein
MSFDPNGITATIYYKYDKTENSTVTRTSSSFTLDLGSSNAHFNQIQYNRSSNFNNAISGSSSTLVMTNNCMYKEWEVQVQK